MSAEPTFSAQGDTGLYWLVGAGTTAGFWAGGASPGAAPTLTQTWAVPTGTYLYLGEDPGDPAAFANAVAAYLSAFRPTAAPRWMWIANPASPMLEWQVTEAHTAPGTQAGTWTMARRVDFSFDTYTVVVRGGGVVGAVDDRDAGWGFRLADPGIPAAALLTPAAALDARAGSALLGMEAATAGCWRFALDLAAPGTGPDAFAQLDCGIRYFVPDPADGLVLPVPFTALRQPAGTELSFFATLDPLRPFAGDRSNLGFFPWNGGGTGAPLQTGFATARGYAVDLTPRPAASAGATPARLVFAFAPADSGPSGATDPVVPGSYYLAPDGSFTVTIADPPSGAAGAIDRLLCGTSGMEYLGLPTQGSSALTFIPGCAAYAPLAADSTGGALTTLGTTSWVYAEPPEGAVIRYYAQPEDAPLFGGPLSSSQAVSSGEGASGDAVGFLDFLEVAAADLPAQVHPFPMAPYRNLDASLVNRARTLEQRALAPCRRAVLTAVATATLSGASAPDAEAEQVGVTPQGLAVGVASDGETWSWVGIGQVAPGPVTRPDLRFTRCDGAFRQAMLTNNLFMVLGNADEFGRCGSVGYQLTRAEVSVIAASPDAAGWPPDLVPAVESWFTARGWPPYATRELFDAALATAYPAMTDEQKLVFRRSAGELTPVVQDWAFRLSPDNWTNPGRTPRSNAYLLFKFVLGRSLAELVGDLPAWAWPAAASPDGNPATAQKEILEIIAGAVPAGGVSALPPSSPYRNFARVVTDPDWTGVLALSANVPLDTLPGPLQVLAAGIDPSAFYAHHLGMSATPYEVSDGALRFDRSSLFGLIDYQNPEDQYFSDDIAFAFRVTQLTVGIRNSAVASFSSRTQLLVNRLFGAPARLLPSDHGNNVMLEGAYQQQRAPDGTVHDAYVFAAPAASTFQSGQPVLDSVELLTVQLVTSSPASPEAGDDTVRATFAMTGNLRFYESPKFDPFCWGPRADGTDGWLRFGNLSVAMSFSLSNPAATTLFTLNDGNLSFDLSNSVARPDSLAGRFPVGLARLVTTPDPVVTPPPDPAPAPTTPESLGFVSVSAPLDQSRMEEPWYGLVYTVDLGTLGALAGSAAFSLEVMAGWTPQPPSDTPAVYLGVRLPGTRDLFGVSLPLQGILQLGFRSIEFLVSEPQDGGPRAYTLRLRDFGLRLLGLSFPPGHNDVYLFGNPDQGAESKVGWYAAYAREADEKKQGSPPARRALQASRNAVRTLPAAPAPAPAPASDEGS